MHHQRKYQRHGVCSWHSQASGREGLRSQVRPGQFLEADKLCQVQATCKSLSSSDEAAFDGLSFTEETARRTFEGASGVGQWPVAREMAAPTSPERLPLHARAHVLRKFLQARLDSPKGPTDQGYVLKGERPSFARGQVPRVVNFVLVFTPCM